MFSNLTIKTRLILLITLLSILLAAIGALGLSGMSGSNQGLKTVYEDRTVPLMDLGKIIDKINLIRLNAVVASNASNQDVVKDATSNLRHGTSYNAATVADGHFGAQSVFVSADFVYRIFCPGRASRL